MGKSKEEILYEEELKKDWNRKLIDHTKKVKEIEKPSPRFPKTVEKACQEYFDICHKDGVKPSVAGLGVALGINRETLLQWVRGEVSVECADVVREYFNMLEMFEETALKDGKTNAIAGVFGMKNNFGYKDQVEHKIVADDGVDIKAIERKYQQRQEIIDEKPIEIDIQEAEFTTEPPIKEEEKVIVATEPKEEKVVVEEKPSDDEECPF